VGGSDLSSVIAAILATAVFSVAKEKAFGEAFKGEDIWSPVLRHAANFDCLLLSMHHLRLPN